MDIFEKIFEKVSRKHFSKKKNADSEVDLKSHEKNLVSFASAVFPKEQAPFLSPSNGFVGLNQKILFLPDRISHFSSFELNKKLYLQLILLNAGAQYLKLKQETGLGLLSQRFAFLKEIPKINQFLDKEFANFKDLQLEIFESLLCDESVKKNKYFVFWEKNFMARESNSLYFPENLKLKFNEILPAYFSVTIPCLPVEKSQNYFKTDSFSSRTDKKSLNEQITTELKKKNNGIVEYVDLKKEKVNPVTHSFEKMETADEYQGGYRFDSGDDELQDQAAALEELSLSKVTRGGEAAKSVYSAEGLVTLEQQDSALIDKMQEKFFYPEWDVKNSFYRPNHCALREQVCVEKNSNDFSQQLTQKHRSSILEWKQKISSLMNDPLWKNRQLEGEEIDFDAFLRDFPLRKTPQVLDGKWYAKKRKSQQEISVAILFDQSLSSDSWVQNKRVLDVIKDSVGLMGLIFEDIITQIQVAGTYSETRHHCYFHIYKQPQDSWESYYQQAPLIQPQGYTRLGPAIRHVIEALKKNKSQKKLLILMTDGKPTDLDGYEGRYGISDVKKACAEAEFANILPFALTIDHEAKQFFPKMFNHYTLINTPDKLPQELYRIIFKLMRSLK